MEFTIENYDFRKAMQKLIDDNIKPILINNSFKKYKKNYFVRERDDLAQIIGFSVRKREVEVFVYFLPIFLPDDYSWCYGVNLTGTSGCYLLSGKYFTTIIELEALNVEVQFNHYQNQHIQSFSKLVNNIKEGVLPEMDRINSLHKFMSIIENNEETIFGCPNRHKCYDMDFFIVAVYKCLCGEYSEGKKQLLQMKQRLENIEKLEIYEFGKKILEIIEYLLLSLTEINDETDKNFHVQYDVICQKMRKKYKLIK